MLPHWLLCSSLTQAGAYSVRLKPYNLPCSALWSCRRMKSFWGTNYNVCVLRDIPPPRFFSAADNLTFSSSPGQVLVLDRWIWWRIDFLKPPIHLTFWIWMCLLMWLESGRQKMLHMHHWRYHVLQTLTISGVETNEGNQQASLMIYQDISERF